MNTNSIDFRSRESLADLVKRERLNLVSRCELRALSAKHAAPDDWRGLLAPPTGRDSDEVMRWKQVARLQQHFETHGPSSTWWARFCACNSAATCLGILQMLKELARERAERDMDDGQAVNWLDLLREGISNGAGTNVQRLRADLRDRLFGVDGD